MKVFVAGATGVAGRRTVPLLVAAGHRVTAVARSAAKATLVQTLGATPVRVNLFDSGAVRRAVEGHNAVVNLATKIPSLSRAMLPRAWSENDRIRTEVSRNLVDAGLASGVRRYVQESLAFTYPDRGDDWIDEDVPVDAPPFAGSVVAAEEQARRFTDAGGDSVVLRFGQFYAPDAASTQAWVHLARRGMSPFLGPPEAFMPTIHADDVARSVVSALAASGGAYNIVDSDPLRQRDAATVLAGAVGVDHLRFAPSPVVKLGGDKARMLMRSQRVSNERFRSATGWAPSFPSAGESLSSVVSAAIGSA